MYIVILAGGTGARFWPLSRKLRPKQLMSVFGGKSMLQRTVERVLPLKPQRILIVTNILQAEETARQLRGLRDLPIDIIAEPRGRNTAPAIGLAAALIAHHDPEASMVVLPADHYITEEEGFRAAILRATAAARQGALVTLGIKPDRPETGYGYIEADPQHRDDGSYAVSRFVEKPPLLRALEFLEAGNFYWNSGMFIWQALDILAEMKKNMPDLYQMLIELRYAAAPWDLTGLTSQIESLYGSIKGESIDYAIMEKAEHVRVIPADFGWSDVGSWRALPEVIPADESDNVIISTDQSIVIDSERCLVYGGHKLVALLGVQDLIVVNTDDALLVCATDRAQEVKDVVETLDQRGLKNYL